MSSKVSEYELWIKKLPKMFRVKQVILRISFITAWGTTNILCKTTIYIIWYIIYNTDIPDADIRVKFIFGCIFLKVLKSSNIGYQKVFKYRVIGIKNDKYRNIVMKNRKYRNIGNLLHPLQNQPMDSYTWSPWSAPNLTIPRSTSNDRRTIIIFQTKERDNKLKGVHKTHLPTLR